MKDNEFNLAMKNDFSGISGLLVYGPDRGLVLEYYDKITKYFNKDGSGLAVVDYEAKSVISDPSDFFADCISDSFFGEKKLVRVKDADDGFFVIMEELMKEPISSFVVVTADNLTKASKLRSFFEKNKFCENIACYQDSQKSIMEVINNFFFQKGIMASSDTKFFISSHLGENRALTVSELEKMSIYIGDKKELTFKEAQACLCSGEIIEIDDFVYGILEGNYHLFLKAQDKFLHEGMTSISLLRKIIYHLQTIYQMRAEFDRSKQLSESIKKINPRVFWKNEGNYLKQVKKFKCENIITVLHELYKAERNLKSSEFGGIDEVYGKRFFLTLASFCAKI